MVMDIRDLRDDADDDQDRPEEKAETPVAAAETLVNQPEPEVDLEELLTLLAEGDGVRQAEAADQLRVLVPSDEGIERLCAVVEDTGGPNEADREKTATPRRVWGPSSCGRPARFAGSSGRSHLALLRQVWPGVGRSIDP